MGSDKRIAGLFGECVQRFTLIEGLQRSFAAGHIDIADIVDTELDQVEAQRTARALQVQSYSAAKSPHPMHAVLS